MNLTIIELLNNISNGSINTEWLTEVHNKNHEKTYIINEPITNHEYKPTILINNKKIILNMYMDQALNHLNENYCQSINQFAQLLKKYINIYNEVQSSHYINEMNIKKYIRIIYDCKTKTYEMFFKYRRYLFHTRESRKDDPFYYALRAVMGSETDQDIKKDTKIYEDDMISINNKKLNIMATTHNLIHTSDSKLSNLDNMFISNTGFYKSGDLLNAIQSYLNAIDSSEYNIFDPDFINDTVKLQESITLSRMIDI